MAYANRSLPCRDLSFYAIAIRDLRHGSNFVRLQFAETIDIFKNGIQIAQHASALFLGQFEVCQIGHVGNIFVSNFHGFTSPLYFALDHEFDPLHRGR